MYKWIMNLFGVKSKTDSKPYWWDSYMQNRDKYRDELYYEDLYAE